MTKSNDHNKKAVEKTVDEVPGAEPGTEAGKIWDEIKDKNIEMFALPNQTVNLHCTPVKVEPSRLYLATRSSSVLPSLEAACGEGFTFELVDRFVIVARATPSLASLLKK